MALARSVPGSKPDGRATAPRRPVAGGFHHPAQTAAQDDPARLSEGAADRLGGAPLLRGRVARTYDRDIRPVRHRGSADDDVDQLVRHDDHLGDLVAVQVRL